MGPTPHLFVEEKCNEVHKRTTSSGAKHNIHVPDRAPSLQQEVGDIQMKSWNAEQLEIVLVVHQSVRSKELVNMLRGFGLSVEYNRLLHVESEIYRSKRREAIGAHWWTVSARHS